MFPPPHAGAGTPPFDNSAPLLYGRRFPFRLVGTSRIRSIVT